MLQRGPASHAGCLTSSLALVISCFLRERVQLVDSLKQRREQVAAAAGKADAAAALAEEGLPADGASKTPLLEEARGSDFILRVVCPCRAL